MFIFSTNESKFRKQVYTYSLCLRRLLSQHGEVSVMSGSMAVLLLWFITIVIVRPLFVCPRLSFRFRTAIGHMLVKVVLLALRMCCVILDSAFNSFSV